MFYCAHKDAARKSVTDKSSSSPDKVIDSEKIEKLKLQYVRIVQLWNHNENKQGTAYQQSDR